MNLKLVTALFFLLLFLVPTEGKGQSLERLEQEWESFRKADDNEKDFRFNSFLMLLNESLQNELSVNSDSSFLKGWHSAVTDSHKFKVYATLMDFEIRPDRVIYCILDKVEEEVIVQYKEVGNISKEGIIEIDLNSLSHGISMKIRKEKQELLTVPDLKTLFVLDELMNSGGQNVVFSLSDSLMSRMEVLLNEPSLFDHDFADYPGLSTLISSDETLKIITWNVEEFTGEHHFFGLIGVRNDEEVRVFQLEDRREDISSPEFAGVGPEKWYGAVYYHIVEEKYRGDTYYTVLGLNGNNSFSRIRVVDVITLGKNGHLRFGAPIFDIDGRTKRRLIFEYSNRANMMLRYDEREKLIVMDHLAPLDPSYEGNRSYYGPDFSYDVLEFNRGKWVLEEDVELRNR
jgi:hypothetical protein